MYIIGNELNPPNLEIVKAIRMSLFWMSTVNSLMSFKDHSSGRESPILLSGRVNENSVDEGISLDSADQ